MEPLQWGGDRMQAGGDASAVKISPRSYARETGPETPYFPFDDGVDKRNPATTLNHSRVIYCLAYRAFALTVSLVNTTQLGVRTRFVA